MGRREGVLVEEEGGVATLENDGKSSEEVVGNGGMVGAGAPVR